MPPRVILCRCEDVTLADVQAAIDRGYRDIEEIKRFTGFGTGPCQGKECLVAAALALVERAGVDAATVPPFTTRPPLQPAPLKLFVRPPAGEEEDGGAR